MMPKESRDAIMCKLFPQTLKGTTIKWFCQLYPSSIASFKDLTKTFLENYSVNIHTGTTYEDLFLIIQEPNEPLRGFIKWFSKAVVEIPNYNDTIAILALKKGLLPKSNFLNELCNKRIKTIVQALAYTQVLIEFERLEWLAKRERLNRRYQDLQLADWTRNNDHSKTYASKKRGLETSSQAKGDHKRSSKR